MKKTEKTKLRLEREALRILQVHELRQVEGGNARRQTGDSVNECCG